MKLTLQLKLLPSCEQAEALLDTMERFNEAASFAARVGFEDGVFSQPSIHERCYRALRERFGLSAQMAVRAIGKAVEAFASDRKTCPSFRPHGAMTYDQRLLSFKGIDRVSLLTVSMGRILVPLVFGEYQGERFDRIKGQADLVHRDGQFFLSCTVDVPEPPPVKVKKFLGVDLGIVRLATDSEGESFTGEGVDGIVAAMPKHGRPTSGRTRAIAGAACGRCVGDKRGINAMRITASAKHWLLAQRQPTP